MSLSHALSPTPSFSIRSVARVARKIVEWYAHADGVVSTSASVVSEVDVESLIHVLDDM